MPIPHEIIQQRRDAALEAKARQEIDVAAERAKLSTLFKSNEWETLLLTLYRQRERSHNVMLSSFDHNEYIDARAYWRALDWVMKLPDTI